MIELPFFSPPLSTAPAAIRSVPRLAAGEEAGRKRDLCDVRGFFQGGFRRKDGHPGAGRWNGDGVVRDTHAHRKASSKIAPVLRERARESIGWLAAAFVAALVGGSAAVAAEGDLETLFRGMTLDGIYGDGAFFTETYHPDGSISYLDSTGPDKGAWRIDEDMFCTFYAEQEGACFFVRRDGTNCFTFFEPIEGPDGQLVPQEGWTSRGWDRSREATCPASPEVET